MNYRLAFKGIGLLVLAFLWLPAAIVIPSVARFGPDILLMDWTMIYSLVQIAPCGLPLAIACAWLWRLNHRRKSVVAGILMGLTTGLAALPAGLFGPIGVAIAAGVVSLPVWIIAISLWRRQRSLY